MKQHIFAAALSSLLVLLSLAPKGSAATATFGQLSVTNASSSIYLVSTYGTGSNAPNRLLQSTAFGSSNDVVNLQGATNGLNSRQGGSALLTNLGVTGISKYATNQALDILYTNTTWVYPTDNIVTALSNAQNNTRVFIMPGNYQYTSRWIFSNSLGQAGINIFNKSNIVFEAAIPGSVRIYSTNIGDGLFITNSTRLAFRGINFEGWVVTNYASSTLYTEPGVVWGGFNIYDVADFEVSNCRFENFHDHVIQGTGANVNWNGASTNRIRIFNNYFANCGSARTNAGISIDGTAIVPDGPWEIFNNTFYGNLRDIEPYSDGDAAVRPWSGTHIYGNRFINTLDSAILSAGSTNANDVFITANVFQREVGWTRRGSNYITSASAVDWNGGHGWKIRNNEILGEWTRGVYVYGNARFGEIAANHFVGITNSGLSTGVPIDLEAGYYHKVAGNHIRNSEGQGIYIHGARDVTVENNEVYNSAAGVGIQIASVSPVISSNIVATGNRLHGNAKGFWDMDFTDNKAIHIVGNDVKGATTDYDFGDTSAGELYLSINGGSTSNRVVRAFEVKDQIDAGSNITLTTNSSGKITIAATGGSGSSNMVTAEIGRLNITNGISMTGAGSAGLDLVSGTSAKTFSISVPDSLTVSSTNKFDFNSPTAGQVIAVHSSSANVTVWTNTTASGSAGAGDWLPNLSYDVLYEPWASGLKGIGTGNNGALGWYISQLGSGASSTILTAPDTGHFGCYRFTTGTTQGAGIGATLGDSTASSTMPLPAISGAVGWTNIYVWKLSATNDMQLWVGMVHGSFSASTNDQSAFIGLKANSATNGNFEFVARSGGTSSIVSSGQAITTGWHTNWIWSTSAGTISFKLNNGSTQTLSSNVPTTEWSPYIFIAKQAATTSINLDVDTYLGIFTR